MGRIVVGGTDIENVVEEMIRVENIVDEGLKRGAVCCGGDCWLELNFRLRDQWSVCRHSLSPSDKSLSPPRIMRKPSDKKATASNKQ